MWSNKRCRESLEHLFFFANVCQQAAKDHRFSKPTSQKPTPLEPKRENIRMVEQEESFYTPPEEGL